MFCSPSFPPLPPHWIEINHAVRTLAAGAWQPGANNPRKRQRACQHCERNSPQPHPQFSRIDRLRFRTCHFDCICGGPILPAGFFKNSSMTSDFANSPRSKSERLWATRRGPFSRRKARHRPPSESGLDVSRPAWGGLQRQRLSRASPQAGSRQTRDQRSNCRQQSRATSPAARVAERNGEPRRSLPRPA